MLFELQSDIGILNRILGLLIEWDIAHGPLIFSFFPNQCGNGLGGIVEVGTRQNIHVVPPIRIDEVMSQQGVVKGPNHAQLIVGQYFEIVFEVMRDLFDAVVFKKGTKFIDHGLCFLSIFGDTHIVTGVFLPGKSNAHQLGLQRVKAGRFGIEADTGLF